MIDPSVVSVQALMPDSVGIDLWEVQLVTDESRLLARNPGPVTSWLTTPTGVIVVTVGVEDKFIQIARWEEDQLHPVRSYEAIAHPLGLSPLEATPDGNSLWVGSHAGTDRLRLMRLDLWTGDETLVDEHPDLDVDTFSGIDRWPWPRPSSSAPVTAW